MLPSAREAPQRNRSFPNGNRPGIETPPGAANPSIRPYRDAGRRSRVKLSDVCDVLLEDCRLRNVSGSALDNYKAVLDQLRDFAKERGISDISDIDVAALRASRVVEDQARDARIAPRAGCPQAGPVARRAVRGARPAASAGGQIRFKRASP